MPIVTARDISARVWAERALRLSQEHIASVFRNASVGLNQSDGTGRYNLVNDRFCEIVGRTRAELMRLSYRDISHPDDVATIKPLLEHFATTGTGFVAEKRYIRPDGSLVWVRNSTSPACDQQGGARGGSGPPGCHQKLPSQAFCSRCEQTVAANAPRTDSN